MSGFYGYTYVVVWYRASSTLLLLALHGMELKELFPVEDQILAGVSRDSCAGCVDELSSHRSLPSVPARLYWHGGGSTSGDGVVHCIPFPYRSSCSWRSVLTSWTWWYRLNSKRDWGVTGPCSWQRQFHGHPQQVEVEQHPCGKMGLWGGTQTETFFALYQEKIPAPPCKIKDSTLQNDKCWLKMETKGLIQLPAMQRKPQNPTRLKPQCWWVDSHIKEPLLECSSWFLRSQLLFMQPIYTFSWLFMQRNYFIV